MSGFRRAPRARFSRAALLVAALACGNCSSPSPPRKTPSPPLTLAGTEYLAPLFRAEIREFRDRYPDSDSIVIRPSGSAEGMEQLVNGEASMTLLLRELTDPEVEAAIRREGLQAFPVAWDAVAVIVNPASPIEQISRTELAAIYRGETKDWASLGWRQGGEIIALTAGPRLGIYAYLEQALLGGDSYALSIYAPATEEEAVEAVATRRSALACVSRPLAEGAGARVKTLRISPAVGLASIPLTRETLVTRRYPLLKPISIATSAHPAPTASNFINFASGMDGQRIIARHGYAPATVPIQIIRTAEGSE